MLELNKIHLMDCLEGLKQLPDNSIDCCVTSPPYYGLRDYGTAVWLGGDENCDHKNYRSRGDDFGEESKQKTVKGCRPNLKHICECGAVREDLQIGLEPTLQEYIVNMVEICEEIRRVLKPTGTFWLNIGDTYSSNKSSFSNLLHASLKKQIFFIGSTDPSRSSSESINILIYDKLSPDDILVPFFSSQRIFIKNRNDNFCQIGNSLNLPCICWVSSSTLLYVVNRTDTDGIFNMSKDISIIVTTRYLNPNSLVRISTMNTIRDGKTPFSIKITNEPVPEDIVRKFFKFDSVTLNSFSEHISNVDFINQSVSFFDRILSLSSDVGNFTVSKSSENQISFHLSGNCHFTVDCVSHFFVSDFNNENKSVSFSPYYKYLKNIEKQFNLQKNKQLIGVPFKIREALMEKGWICRNSIIWAKATSGEERNGSSMPESVKDRLTSSHEHIFLLTKKDKYYFDSYALKEPIQQDRIRRSKNAFISNKMNVINGNFENRNHDYIETGLANMRNVWRINLQPGSSGQHIAGYPEKIPYYCIKAGSSEKGCCAVCGKPYLRILEEDGKINHSWAPGTRDYHKLENAKGRHGSTSSFLTDTSVKYKHIGWQKTCICETEEIVQSVILDPFMGSGTTALVALKEGRDFIGFELNQEYVNFANERIKVHNIKERFF